jgi:hypothetical protein
MRIRTIRLALGVLMLVTLVTACAPEVGSDAWCKKMRDTPSGDWSTNDATAYAKNCILK